MSESNKDAGWQLGCMIGVGIIGFFVWVFFFREPDPEWTRKVAEETERREQVEQTRRNNARIACDSGLASACVEYAEMIRDD